MMFRICAFSTAVLLMVFCGISDAAENSAAQQAATLRTELVNTSFFCGNCHILTYPAIFQKGYDTWKESKHLKASCVDCHYPPDVNNGGQPSQKMKTGAADKHIPATISEDVKGRFTHLPIGSSSIKTRSAIVDASCMTGDCHGSPDSTFMKKPLQLGEKKIRFVHAPHFEKKNQVAGMQVGCTSCHQHLTETNHFEVSQATCTLCHFKNAVFNEGRGRCELCHTLPTKVIQTSGTKQITHTLIKRENVSCAGCHLDLIKALGGANYRKYFENYAVNMAVRMGEGGVRENCQQCHDQEKALKEINNKTLMHAGHVNTPNARCFECHRGWKGWNPAYLHLGILQSGTEKD